MYKMPFNLKLNNHLTSLPFSGLSLFVLLQDTAAGHEGRRPQGHMVQPQGTTLSVFLSVFTFCSLVFLYFLFSCISLLSVLLSVYTFCSLVFIYFLFSCLSILSFLLYFFTFCSLVFLNFLFSCPFLLSVLLSVFTSVLLSS